MVRRQAPRTGVIRDRKHGDLTFPPDGTQPCLGWTNDIVVAGDSITVHSSHCGGIDRSPLRQIGQPAINICQDPIARRQGISVPRVAMVDHPPGTPTFVVWTGHLPLVATVDCPPGTPTRVVWKGHHPLIVRDRVLLETWTNAPTRIALTPPNSSLSRMGIAGPSRDRLLAGMEGTRLIVDPILRSTLALRRRTCGNNPNFARCITPTADRSHRRRVAHPVALSTNPRPHRGAGGVTRDSPLAQPTYWDRRCLCPRTGARRRCPLARYCTIRCHWYLCRPCSPRLGLRPSTPLSRPHHPKR